MPRLDPQRRGSPPDAVRKLCHVHIDADTDDHMIDIIHLSAHLRQDPHQFPAVYDHIVRPFDLHLHILAVHDPLRHTARHYKSEGRSG